MTLVQEVVDGPLQSLGGLGMDGEAVQLVADLFRSTCAPS